MPNAPKVRYSFATVVVSEKQSPRQSCSIYCTRQRGLVLLLCLAMYCCELCALLQARSAS